MDPFDSAWLKWARGVQHAQALQSDFKHFAEELDGPPPIVPTTGEYDPNRHGFAMTVESALPIPAAWNLALGDIAHNFRCSLDHIAWSLVQRGNLTLNSAAEENRVYFPITNSRNHFNNVAAKMLPGARPADLATVRRYQPWVKGKTRVQWNCLSILHGLGNFDEHREIQDIWWAPDWHDYEVVRSQDCAWQKIKVWPHVRAEVDAELAFHIRPQDRPTTGGSGGMAALLLPNVHTSSVAGPVDGHNHHPHPEPAV